MLLTAGLILMLIAAFLEIQLMRHMPWLRDLVCRYSIITIAISVALSIALGSLFGAAGVIVMIAGIGSTILTQPYYWYHRPEIRAKVQSFLAPWRSLGRGINKTVRAITWPARTTTKVKFMLRRK